MEVESLLSCGALQRYDWKTVCSIPRVLLFGGCGFPNPLSEQCHLLPLGTGAALASAHRLLPCGAKGCSWSCLLAHRLLPCGTGEVLCARRLFPHGAGEVSHRQPCFSLPMVMVKSQESNGMVLGNKEPS